MYVAVGYGSGSIHEYLFVHFWGYVVMVRQLFSPTVRWSDSSMVRQFDSPTGKTQLVQHLAKERKTE
jgi:hypothetical protein